MNELKATDIKHLVKRFGKEYDFFNVRAGHTKLECLNINKDGIKNSLSKTIGVFIETIKDGRDRNYFIPSLELEKIEKHLKDLKVSNANNRYEISLSGENSLIAEHDEDYNNANLSFGDWSKTIKENSRSGWQINLEVKTLETKELIYNNYENFGLKSECHTFCTLIAKNDQIFNDFTIFMPIAFTRKIQNRDLESVIRMIKKMKLRMYNYKNFFPPACGTFPIIFSSEVAGILIHEALGHLLEADFAYRANLANKIGTKITRPDFNLIDNAKIQGLFGSYIIDSDGEKGIKKVLIKNGILMNFMHSKKTSIITNSNVSGNGRAGKINMPSMPRMSNLILLPGDGNFEGFLKDIKSGYYITRLSGNCIVFPEKDLFWLEAESGQLIENGKLAKPICGIAITGKISGLLNKILGIDSIPGKITPGFCLKNNQIVPVSSISPKIYIKNLQITSVI